ncbi:hypothetical protein ACS0TY_027685 [Phlomoides rotata]
MDKKEPLGQRGPKSKIHKKLWKSWATRKATITAWKLLKDRMATTDNLARRGIILDDEAKICQMCKEKEESTRHLFFECKVTYDLWSGILKWLGVSMALHIIPSIHFLLFENSLGRGYKAKAAASIWIGMVWSIWKLRNEVIFNKATINLERELSKIKINVWNWISIKEVRLSDCNSSLWFENPWACLNVL